MIDTEKNIDETIREMHEWFDSMDSTEEEKQDLSYLDD